MPTTSSDRPSAGHPSAMPFGELLGVEVETETADQVVCRLTVTEDHLNQGLIAHGGVLFSLADTALGLLVNPPGESTTWVGTAFTLQLFRPLTLGEAVRATASLEHRSRRVAACRVVLERERDGKVVGILGNQLLATPPPASGDGDVHPGSVRTRVQDARSPLVRALRAAWLRDGGYEDAGKPVDRPPMVVVAYEDSQPCGYTSAHVSSPVGLVTELWVHPRWRRRGIASTALRGIEDLVRSAGAAALEIALPTSGASSATDRATVVEMVAQNAGYAPGRVETDGDHQRRFMHKALG